MKRPILTLFAVLASCATPDLAPTSDVAVVSKNATAFAVTPDVTSTLELNGTQAFAKSGRIATRQGGDVVFMLTTDAGKVVAPVVRLIDPATGAIFSEDLAVVAVDKRTPVGGGSFTQSWKATLPRKAPVGIIQFEVKWSDATGHFDLWNGFAAPGGGVPADATTVDSVDLLAVPDGTTWKWNTQLTDPSVLALVDTLLRKLPVSERTSAWRVAREISWRANNEVLHGRWDGDYKEGKEPWSWTSSTEITAVFQKTGTRVKYGQCWVFAGVTTTALRSLGIPTRSVTNLQSAHERGQIADADYLPGSDRCAGAERGKDPKVDAIWNFHVWNEFYVSEDGSTVGYAVDPTPYRDLTPSKFADPVRLDELVKMTDTGAL